ncbi:pyridoxal-phosphate-dependent aminotransferase family protein [Tuberibacillus sp. Marseille-P3662]|uniref:pyridoxal-phosphate-dependent aminotransferase family protein n=1 Tax=Tuberibacillus sp. Marseille-P3662 TaxID=1965358 RepID=UPI000A1CDAC4|nr:alanine--glyoxylate aminotransferase family protein [Tuberibacillus sp. Marseille-P3662]
MFLGKDQLRTPGPTPVPDRVKYAMNQPMIGHRGEDFAQLFASVSEKLKPLFGTTQPVYMITGSGTSALETAVINTLEPGDEVIVVVTGAFGDRFAAICEQYGVVTHRLDVEWGRACPPDTLKSFLQQHSNAKAVIATYCETSTGVLNPVKDYAEVVHQHSDALVIVDAVSSLGGVPMQMDEWDIDMVVTGSQKALMLPPGLGLVTASERAWQVIEGNKRPSFYLDLQACRDSYEKNTTPYTPAVSLIQGLNEVCDIVQEEGLENVFARHRLIKDMTRAAVKAHGLPLLVSDDDASPTVTAIKGEQYNPDELRKQVKDTYGLALAGGQKQLKGQVFRIGHMGDCTPVDILSTVSVLEMGLKQLGMDIEYGAGVRAAQEVLSQNV